MSRAINFINTYWPHAERMQAAHGVPALVAMAQSALETGWGQHAPGNMMFGIKAGKSWKGEKQLLITTEYHSTPDHKYPEVISVVKIRQDRYKYLVKDWFRKYPTPYESFVDYARMLSGDNRYAPAFQHKEDPERFALEVANAGYATAPDYFVRIRSMMRSILKKKMEIQGSQS